MKYLDADQTIVYDEEKKEIRFHEDKSKNFKLPDGQEWVLFDLLVSKAGEEYLIDKLKAEKSYSKEAIQTYASRLRGSLNERGVLCNRGKENDTGKITIINKRSRKVLGRDNGSYTLILPEKNKKNESILANLFWTRYESLSAQKDGENKNGEIIATIGEVYQFPTMQKNGKKCKWSEECEETYERNILIEAPNGYGKTTFMRSMVLAATYPYRDKLTESEKQQYKEIKKFHGFDESTLFIYIQCKDIKFNEMKQAENVHWIYDTLSGMESIRLDSFMDIENFSCLIREYNEKKKLILLIDGLDEIVSKDRASLMEKLKDFQDDSEFGNESRIIMTTRPLFWQVTFTGYQKYTISNQNIVEDRTIFEKFLNSYIRNKEMNINEIRENVISNPYLADVIYTPAAIVWVALAFTSTDAFCIWIERVIVQMMVRYNSTDLIANKDFYERVYELIAYKYLANVVNDDGLLFVNTDGEMYDLIKSCTVEIEDERVRNSVSYKEENLGELFFTNVALMEKVERGVKFASWTYAFHLAGKHIVREFLKSDRNIIGVLETIPIKFRYTIMMIASSLALSAGDYRLFQGYSTKMDPEDWDNMAEIFCNYIWDRWNSPRCEQSEKVYIQDAIAQIRLEYYGKNVYTRKDVSDELIKGMAEIVNEDLGEYTEAVKRFRKKG